MASSLSRARAAGIATLVGTTAVVALIPRVPAQHAGVRPVLTAAAYYGVDSGLHTDANLDATVDANADANPDANADVYDDACGDCYPPDVYDDATTDSGADAGDVLGDDAGIHPDASPPDTGDAGIHPDALPSDVPQAAKDIGDSSMGQYCPIERPKNAKVDLFYDGRWLWLIHVPEPKGPRSTRASGGQVSR